MPSNHKTQFIEIASLATAEAADLNAVIGGDDAEFITFATPSTSPKMAHEVADGSALAGVVSLALTTSPEFAPLAELPEWMVPFLPIDSLLAAVAFRRDSVSDAGVGGFREVGGVLREWLVRAVLAGEEIRVRVEETDRQPAAFPFPALRPSHPAQSKGWIADAVDDLDAQAVLPSIASQDDIVALRAGLLQVNDLLDGSHEYSQSVQGAGRNAAGDYWHAIMHRREPDYSNAKYWFRRVGSHVIFDDLAATASPLLDQLPDVRNRWQDQLLPGGEWDPFAFVDLCQSCPRSEDDETSQFAQRMQWFEMLSLLRQTLVDATT